MLNQKEEIELHDIVYKLQKKADCAHEKMFRDLYESWIDQIISGDATLIDARHMLAASKL